MHLIARGDRPVGRPRGRQGEPANFKLPTLEAFPTGSAASASAASPDAIANTLKSLATAFLLLLPTDRTRKAGVEGWRGMISSRYPPMEPQSKQFQVMARDKVGQVHLKDADSLEEATAVAIGYKRAGFAVIIRENGTNKEYSIDPNGAAKEVNEPER